MRLPLIELIDAEFGYNGRAVVRAERLSLAAGECLGVFGHNGSGKSTLVRGLLGLLPPVRGRVQRHRPGLRLGYLSQYRGIDPTWPMSGFDAASLNLSAHRRFGRLTTHDRERIKEAMRETGVLELADRSFGTLSGGQQQRLLLAGALAAKPDILVLDEPTDGLDVVSRDRLLRTLTTLKTDGLCVVLISHELDDLMVTSDAVAWLHDNNEPGEPSSVACTTPDALANALLHGGAR